jgi:CHAD domain-containing protein
MRGRLQGRQEATGCSALTAETRERLLAAVGHWRKTLTDWPLHDIEFSEIATRLCDGYRRARRALPRSWSEADEEELHELRQRIVVHRYQMELISPLWPRFGRLWTGEAQRLRERLGACQDLAVLSQLTAPHQPLAPWRARLTESIKARRAVHVTAASRIARRLFAEKPSAFRRRLMALGDTAQG